MSNVRVDEAVWALLLWRVGQRREAASYLRRRGWPFERTHRILLSRGPRFVELPR